MLPRLIGRLVNIVVLVASVAWLATTPDRWEPFIVTIGAVFGMVTQELIEYEKHRTDLVTKQRDDMVPPLSDLELFKRHIAHFTSTGVTIQFLKTHDMGASFHSSCVEPLWEYAGEWRGPEFEFLFPELEEARADFDRKTRDFVGVLVNETAPAHAPEFFSMGLRDFEDRPHMLKAKEKLNQLSREASDAYDHLYRVGRRLFKNEKL